MSRALTSAISACLLTLAAVPYTVADDAKTKFPAAPTFPFDSAAAQKYQREYAEAAGLPVEFKNEVGLVFLLVPPGAFLMGSPDDEPGRSKDGQDETLHSVTLTKPFYLSRHETTVGQFRRFVEATQYQSDGQKRGGGHAHDALAEWKHRDGVTWLKPGYAGPFELRDDHPVVQVSHADSLAFCRWLAERAPPPKAVAGRYDLPTEAQWEWACRAGTGSRFWWGPAEDASGKVVNVGDKSLQRVHPRWPRTVMAMDDGHPFAAPVGTYQPNAFGLCDMLGNVWEFCSSRAGRYPREPSIDQGDLSRAESFAVRGGGWSNVTHDARCATRNSDPPHFCHSNLGFRVAIQLDATGDNRGQ